MECMRAKTHAEIARGVLTTIHGRNPLGLVVFLLNRGVVRNSRPKHCPWRSPEVNILQKQSQKYMLMKFEVFDWAAANGGVTNGGLRGVWPPFLEIGRNRPFSPFFCLFSPFSGGCKEHLGNPENGGKRPFSSDHLLNPHLRHSNF